MPHFLVAIHHPDQYNPAIAEDAEMMRDIDALNDDMVAAGIRVFVGGLKPISNACSIRTLPNGEVAVTDGPYLQTNEHIGGFWVLEVPDREAAMVWGRKAAIACRAPVEVRPFF